MKSTNAKKGTISPHQLFFIFLVSRTVVALTFYQSVLINGISPDSLLSSLLAMGVNLLLCLPAYFCCSQGKNPFETKLGKILYSAYFLFFAGVNIARFAFFAADKTSRGNNALLFIILMTAAACYAAYLKIEAVSRFSVLCAVTALFVLAVIMLLNSKNFRLVNLLPFFVGNRADILKNSVIFLSNSVEPALYLALYGKCEKNQAKSLFFGITASYAAIILMILFCVGVLGSAASLFSFPVYTLFQMTAFGNFSRLDILYTAIGFFALFAKCAVIILCAEEGLEAFNIKRKPKMLGIFALISILSFVIYSQFFAQSISLARIIYLSLSIAFCIVLPLAFLVFKRKDEKNEKSL